MPTADSIAFVLVTAAFEIWVFKQNYGGRLGFQPTVVPESDKEKGLDKKSIGTIATNLAALGAFVLAYVLYVAKLPNINTAWRPVKDSYLIVSFGLFLGNFFIDWIAKWVLAKSLTSRASKFENFGFHSFWVVASDLIFVSFWVLTIAWMWSVFTYNGTDAILPRSSDDSSGLAVWITSIVTIVVYVFSNFIRRRANKKKTKAYVAALRVAGNIMTDKDIPSIPKEQLVKKAGQKLTVRGFGPLDMGDYRTPYLKKMSEKAVGKDIIPVTLLKTEDGDSVILSEEDHIALHEALTGEKVGSYMGARAKLGVATFEEYVSSKRADIVAGKILDEGKGMAAYYHVEPSLVAAFNLAFLFACLQLFGVQLQAVVFFALAAGVPLLYAMKAGLGLWWDMFRFGFLITTSVAYACTFLAPQFNIILDFDTWSDITPNLMENQGTTSWAIAIGVIVSTALALFYTVMMMAGMGNGYSPLCATDVGADVESNVGTGISSYEVRTSKRRLRR